MSNRGNRKIKIIILGEVSCFCAFSSVIRVMESNKFRSGRYVAQMRTRKIIPQKLVTNVASRELELGILARGMEIILKLIEKISCIMEVAGIIWVGTGSSYGGGGCGDWGRPSFL